MTIERGRTGWSTAHAVAALCAVWLACVATSAAAQTGARAATSPDLSNAIESAARLVGPSVVQIFTTSYAPGEGLVPSSGDLVTTQRASGSGVIVDPEGYILTNAHVVSGAYRLRVELPIAVSGKSILAARSRTVNGRVVGLDAETDLALVKIEDRNLPALTFADSDELKIGQLVLAFGSPLGLNNSVSLGVVSAVARQLEPESPMIYVQTDAFINPGSSGGPLVDLRGRVVGINTLILSQDGAREGPAFAAPSNIARTVYEHLRKLGRVRRGDIGARAQTVTPVLAAGLALPRDYGVVVADVRPGSPAARAGLRPGDLVISVDGKSMENGRQFQVTLYRRFVGEVVNLEVLRDGKTVKVPVAMTERDDAVGGLNESVDPRQNLVPRLGVLGVNLDARVAQVLPGLRVRAGVVVVATVAGAIDSRDGGLAVGDVVYAVNRQAVTNLTELRAALDGLRPGDAVVLHLERGGELMFLAFTVE